MKDQLMQQREEEEKLAAKQKELRRTGKALMAQVREFDEERQSNSFYVRLKSGDELKAQVSLYCVCLCTCQCVSICVYLCLWMIYTWTHLHICAHVALRKEYCPYFLVYYSFHSYSWFSLFTRVLKQRKIFVQNWRRIMSRYLRLKKLHPL